jgi:hypothetical protein
MSAGTTVLSRRKQQTFDAIRRAYPAEHYQHAQQQYMAERKRRKQLAELLRAAAAVSNANAAAAAATAAAAAAATNTRADAVALKKATHTSSQQHQTAPQRCLVTKMRRPSELFLIGSEVETLKTHTYIGHGQSVNQMLLQYNGIHPDGANDAPSSNAQQPQQQQQQQQQVKGRGTWFPCLTIVIPAHEQARFNKQWRIERTSAWRKDARNIDRRTTWGLKNIVLKYSTPSAPFVWFIATRLIDPVQYPTLFSLLCTDFYDADLFARFLFQRTSARSETELVQTIQNDMRIQGRARLPIQYFYSLLKTAPPRQRAAALLVPSRTTTANATTPESSDDDDDEEEAEEDEDMCYESDDDNVYECDAFVDTTSFEHSYHAARKALRG